MNGLYIAQPQNFYHEPIHQANQYKLTPQGKLELNAPHVDNSKNITYVDNDRGKIAHEITHAADRQMALTSLQSIINQEHHGVPPDLAHVARHNQRLLSQQAEERERNNPQMQQYMKDTREHLKHLMETRHQREPKIGPFNPDLQQKTDMIHEYFKGKELQLSTLPLIQPKKKR